MKRKIIAVIPAQTKNRYSKKGDLEDFSGVTLLEWKISQIKRLKYVDKIFVLSKAKKIEKICKENNVYYLKRPKNSSITNLFKFVGKRFKSSDILWTNPSSPFLKEETILKVIKKYIKKKFYSDGIVTTRDLREYIIFKNKFINERLDKAFVSRQEMKNTKMLTNGVYLSSNKNYIKGFPFGKKPMFHDIDWFESNEVKECKNSKIYKMFIELYFHLNSNNR